MTIYHVSPMTFHKRNSARLDLLTSMAFMMDQPSSNSNSPHDSLSPLDGLGKFDSKDDELSEEAFKRFSFEYGSDEEAVFHPKQVEQQPHLTCQELEDKHEAATTKLPTTEACSPRSTLIIRDHRPSDLSLTKTNGLTTISLVELKQCICDARTASNTTIVQVPRPKANHLPKTPDTPSPFVIMGNKPSSIAGSPAPDDASIRSVVRKPNRVLRKSSTNLLKRIDSQTPLQPKLTGTIIRVQQPISPISLDGSNEESDNSTADRCIDLSHSSDQSQNAVPSQSVAKVTMNENNAFQPLSDTTAICEPSAEAHFEPRVQQRSPYEEGKSESNVRQKQTNLHKAFSPSIPAPSPLPEDSPHKYGLKDRTDTPDVLEPEEINVVKARRRSSGLDIFNEAKSLQSASSFLNGLSTSRRRAESTQLGNDASTTWTVKSQETTRPESASRPQLRPTSSSNLQSTYASDRCRSHNFKASGFAYSRPLAMAQIKCYRNHACLKPSRNKKAAVECAVCHIDDDRDHFSCSWCAIRMCRFCRKDFAERGMTALKERIKQAELGSPSSSSDSLSDLRPTSKP